MVGEKGDGVRVGTRVKNVACVVLLFASCFFIFFGGVRAIAANQHAACRCFVCGGCTHPDDVAEDLSLCCICTVCVKCQPYTSGTHRFETECIANRLVSQTRFGVSRLRGMADVAW